MLRSIKTLDIFSEIGNFKSHIYFNRKNMELLFIRSILNQDWYTLSVKLGWQALAWVIVLVACFIDLRTGMKASKANGVFKTNSYGLRKTLKKFKDYMDVMLMAFLCDIFLSIFYVRADDFAILRLFDLPLVTIVLFIYTIATEFISVLENKKKEKGAPVYTQKAIDAINDLAKVVGVDGIEKLADLIKKGSDDSNKSNEEL